MDLRRRSELLAAGYSSDEVRRAVRRGALTVVRRGMYVAGPLPDDDGHHLLLVRAACAQVSPDAVVSHVSAARVHGLPVWAVPLDRVHTTRDRRRSGARRGRLLHAHSAPLDADEISVVDGIVVTSVARTVIDVARTTSFEQAVVVADSALGLRLVDASALEAEVARRPRWPGMPAARRVVAFADRLSGGVGESRSRVAILRAGLPTPTLQWEVRAAADDRFIGQVDFGWRSLRTVGEFDGRIKYGRLLKPGQDPGEAVYQEKLREDDLRAEDLAVVRWTWHDLRDFTPTATRLRQRYRPA